MKEDIDHNHFALAGFLRQPGSRILLYCARKPTWQKLVGREQFGSNGGGGGRIK